MTGREEGRRRWEPSCCRGSTSPSRAGGAAGRCCGQGGPGRPPGPPSRRERRGPPASPPGPGGQLCRLCPHAARRPEPWSPREACSPPWWSRATSSPWPPCGSGAGDAGGRRTRKVSRRLSPGAATSHSRRPCQREREAGRGASSHPCISPSPPLPVPSGPAARGRRTQCCSCLPRGTRDPAAPLRSPGWAGGEAGAGWRGRAGRPSPPPQGGPPAARDPASASGCQHGRRGLGPGSCPAEGPPTGRLSCREGRQVPPHPLPGPRPARGGQPGCTLPPHPQLKVTRSGLQPGSHAQHSTARQDGAALRSPRGWGDRAAGQRDCPKGSAEVCSGLRPARPGVRASTRWG